MSQQSTSVTYAHQFLSTDSTAAAASLYSESLMLVDDDEGEEGGNGGQDGLEFTSSSDTLFSSLNHQFFDFHDTKQICTSKQGRRHHSSWGVMYPHLFQILVFLLYWPHTFQFIDPPHLQIRGAVLTSKCCLWFEGFLSLFVLIIVLDQQVQNVNISAAYEGGLVCCHLCGSDKSSS